MKKGVKRDLIAVIVFTVIGSIYLCVGFLFAPDIPNRPTRAETFEGSLREMQDTFDQAHHDLVRRRFLDRWMWNGICLGVTVVLGYSGWRGYVLSKRTDVTETEKPEDSYLSGRAVAIIAGIFAVGIGALVTWSVLSNH